jgi:NAD-dependent dihydropyrimidine dehydrogenase PreA subunit
MKTTRKIVHIDPEKCDGCGECVPSCAEGAIQIIDGKARLVADKLCDGLGACLGHCPRGAIHVEERPAEEFDSAAVAAHLGHALNSHAPTPASAPAPAPMFVAMAPAAAPAVAPAQPPATAHHGGCPGSRMRTMAPRPVPAMASKEAGPSQLRQWPVQLTLLPEQGRIWQDADVLLAADCVPFAYPDFHAKMLAGKTLAIACPKLDDAQRYVDKLARIFAANTVKSVSVARMEVPCCGGLVRIAELAIQQSGRTDLALKVVVVGIEGDVNSIFSS